MDQQLNIPFGLLYNILTCFNRRELCHLRNVDHRYYTVIENIFATTSPYLVFDKRFLSARWRWGPTSGNQYEDMPFNHNLICDSKFIRFKYTNAYATEFAKYTVRDIGHVWENQHVSMHCCSVWDEHYSRITATAKIVDLFARNSIPFLRQLTSGNCVRLSLTDRLSLTLVVVELPWDHILDFLFKPNTECIDIRAKNPFMCQRELVLDFLQHVKQKFLDTVAPISFKFQFHSETADNGFIFEDFLVKNQRTKQSLRFHSTDKEFRLTVEKQDQ